MLSHTREEFAENIINARKVATTNASGRRHDLAAQNVSTTLDVSALAFASKFAVYACVSHTQDGTMTSLQMYDIFQY